jgi:hypothetical protein
MAAIAATGTPETSRRDPTKSAYKVKAVVPADIVRRPSLTDAVEKVADDLTKPFRRSILDLFLSRSSFLFWRC